MGNFSERLEKRLIDIVKLNLTLLYYIVVLFGILSKGDRLSLPFDLNALDYMHGPSYGLEKCPAKTSLFYSVIVGIRTSECVDPVTSDCNLLCLYWTLAVTK